MTHQEMPWRLSDVGWLRVAAVSPEVSVANPRRNAEEICRVLHRLAEADVELALFPELCLTGYSCGDLFFQRVLLEGAIDALLSVRHTVAELGMHAVVGMPLAVDGKIYNTAVWVAPTGIAAIVPKRYLPGYGEYYEPRWFASAAERDTDFVAIEGDVIPFGDDILVEIADRGALKVGIEICEDLWAPMPPGTDAAMAGAVLLLNPSASNELVGKRGYRSSLVAMQSARCLCAYVYASAGATESTTDTVFSGHCMVAENGAMLCEGRRFSLSTEYVIADIDAERLVNERQTNTSFRHSAPAQAMRTVSVMTAMDSAPLALSVRAVESLPFVPSGKAAMADTCREIAAIQATALARRLRHIGAKAAVVGLSGGLDSTLALMVMIHACEAAGMPRSAIHALSMPGFGTTHRTKSNAELLANLLGVTFMVKPIGEAVMQHFEVIGHDPAVRDITYENAQARERTQILMDYANRVGGIVVGTGDLSEMALGWSTYNADHMSMYAVNSGVPKTLVRTLVEWYAAEAESTELTRILLDICSTPVSPELLPPAADGDIAQKTEDLVGPYELHDFFLFHTVRYAARPRRCIALAVHAFAGKYSAEQVIAWYKVFIRRFFVNQFKRSCTPDGPKVGSIALSPRADWRMPSDASFALWLADAEQAEGEWHAFAVSNDGSVERDG